MTRWPGHGLPPDGSFQFVEHEFMKAEDYDAFIEDPSDWTIRTYLPRAFSELEAWRSCRRWACSRSAPTPGSTSACRCGTPAVNAASRPSRRPPRRSSATGRQDHGRRRAPAGARLPVVPIPPLAPIVEAPFDFMSDTLRGMRGIMLDMLRRPDKLLAARGARPQVPARVRRSTTQDHRPQDRVHPAAPRVRRLHVDRAVREVLLAAAQGA